MEIKNKAIFFSIDALIAMGLIFLVLIITIPGIKYSQRETEIHRDTLQTLSSLKIGEIDNQEVRDYIQGKEVDLDKSLLEYIGELYISDAGKASTFAALVLSKIETNQNFGLWYVNEDGTEEEIYSRGSKPYSEAKNIQVARQTISGIQKGSAATGFVAKAWLKKITKKQNTLVVKGDLICTGWKKYTWGDYCSQNANNTIFYNVTIPSDAVVSSAIWLAEGVWSSQKVTLSVNKNQVFDGSIFPFVIRDVTSYVTAGENEFVFNSTKGGEDGASHIVIEYTTSELNTLQDRNIFPINRVIGNTTLHYEKSIFVPQEINSMEVLINTDFQTKLSIRKSEQTIWVGTKTPSGGSVTFTDAEIKSALSSRGIPYSSLKNEYFFFIIEVSTDTDDLVYISYGSKVKIESEEVETPFGSIDITQDVTLLPPDPADEYQNSFYKHLLWQFYLPTKAIPFLADWQFGWLSGTNGADSQKASANSITLYESPPAPIVRAFNRFGYSPELGNGLFIDGTNNNFALDFTGEYGISNESSYGSVTYFVQSFVGYDATLPKAKGGTRTVTFQDDTTAEIIIGDPTDIWDPEADAIDDAIERLLAQLDTDPEGTEGYGKIDVIITQTDVEMEALDISGVPFLWTTEAQVRTWY